MRARQVLACILVLVAGLAPGLAAQRSTARRQH